MYSLKMNTAKGHKPSYRGYTNFLMSETESQFRTPIDSPTAPLFAILFVDILGKGAQLKNNRSE
jgi:hypothetical protein